MPDDEKVLTQANTNEPKPQPVGSAVGGITGAATGASVGALAGPLGILVGAAAGALGGWWAGHAISDTLHDYDDENYRRLHSSRPTAGDYTEVRDYYRFGHLAGSNPDYQGRRFEEIEPELRNTFGKEARLGRWEDVRDYVAEGYRSRETRR
jgi:hypothetical protein